MLEQALKMLFMSVIITLFIIFCIKNINNSANNAFMTAKHSALINELMNGTSGGNGNLIVCKPALINNTAGRVCVAS